MIKLSAWRRAVCTTSVVFLVLLGCDCTAEQERGHADVGAAGTGTDAAVADPKMTIQDDGGPDATVSSQCQTICAKQPLCPNYDLSIECTEICPSLPPACATCLETQCFDACSTVCSE